MKMVYICSPCRGNYKRNIKKARKYCKEAIAAGVLPIAPHIYFTQFLDDKNPKERHTGLTLAFDLLFMCDEMWVYGIDNPSEGMRGEIARANAAGIPIITKEVK